MKKLLIPLLLILALVNPSFAMAATLVLSPSSGTFNKNCPMDIEIKLDTGGQQTDGTDAIIFYDSSKLTATTPTNGSIYSEYPGTNVDDQGGKITISGLASVASAFSGAGTLATLHFTVKDTSTTGATVVRFDFDPNDKTKTTDSNVVERGTVVDILSSVTNGNYTIGSGTTCGASSSSTSPGGTNTPGGQGAVIVVPSTPSAQIPVKQIPVKTLPPAGSEQFTFTIAIVGSVLTVLGILGLALL